MVSAACVPSLAVIIRWRQEYVAGGEETIAHAQVECCREPSEPPVHQPCSREGAAYGSLAASGAGSRPRAGGGAPALAPGPEWLWQRVLHCRCPEYDDELA